jgi:hypothetical protein
MVAALPTLDPLWRTTPRDDRELIRGYSDQPAVQVVLHDLTVAMNRMADVSPAAVAQIQTWIDEVEDLEEQWAGYVADGTAAQLQASEYEGPIGGTAMTRDDMLKRADVLEWDTSANRVRISNGAGSGGTQASAISGRIGQLKARILKAMDLSPMAGARLIRS